MLAKRALRIALATFSAGAASFLIASLGPQLPRLTAALLFHLPWILLLSNTVALTYGKAALLGSNVDPGAQTPARRAVAISYLGYPSILILWAAIQIFVFGGES